MPVELNPVTISDLDRTSPGGGEFLSEGDDHLRNIKSVLETQFPGELGAGFSKVITATEDDLNATSNATSNFQSQIDALAAQVAGVLPSVFPVGSIFTSIVGTNPATTLGFGTWVEFAKGSTLIGVDTSDPDFSAPNAKGGSKNLVVPAHSHTGTAQSAGAHTHFAASDVEDNDTGPDFGRVDANRHMHKSVRATEGDDNYRYRLYGTPSPDPSVSPTNTAGGHTHTLTIGSTGESPASKNLPPYVTVYFWRRVT